MKMTSLALASCALSALATGAMAADSAGEPGRSSGKSNPLKNVYFGEEHMHTRNSFDAFTIGVNQTWDDAYNYAKGKVITKESALKGVLIPLHPGAEKFYKEAGLLK